MRKEDYERIIRLGVVENSPEKYAESLYEYNKMNADYADMVIEENAKLQSENTRLKNQLRFASVCLVFAGIMVVLQGVIYFVI